MIIPLASSLLGFIAVKPWTEQENYHRMLFNQPPSLSPSHSTQPPEIEKQKKRSRFIDTTLLHK